MKKCPFCAEEIPDEMMICPLCRQDLYFTDQEVEKRFKAEHGTIPVEPVYEVPKKFILQPGERVVFVSYWKIGWGNFLIQFIAPLVTIGLFIWLGGAARVMGWVLLFLAVAFWLYIALLFLFGWAVLTDRRIVFNWAGFPWKKIDLPVEQVWDLVAGFRKIDVIPRNGSVTSYLIPEIHAFIEEFDDLVRVGTGNEDQV